MAIALKVALRELLRDWRADLSPEWQQVLDDTELAFDKVDERLELYSWEPIFPSRRHFALPGEPPGAHIFRAFDGLSPGRVRCVVVGQDPYPSVGFSTGRAFEAGDCRYWNELEKMFSCSVRSLLQFLYAFRSGEGRYASGTDGWPDVMHAICDPESNFPAPDQLVQGWVKQGVLMLNASLTLSRFSVEGDPHQVRGHLPLWRPLIARLLNYFFNRASQPVVIILFGDAALEAALAGGIVSDAELDTHPAIISLPHPAAGNEFLRHPNPFELCNERLVARNAEPIDW